MTITEGTFTGQSQDTESYIESTSTFDEVSGTYPAVDVEIDYTGYLKRITVALETIASKLTTIDTKITSIDANINRVRILGDWASYTDEEALGQGFKTAGFSSYNNIEKASLYKSLVLEGGILTYNKNLAEQNLSIGPIDPPQGIQQAAIDRIAALADEFDQVAPGTIPARDLPDPFEGNF